LVKLITLETNRNTYTLDNIGADNRIDEKIEVLDYSRRNLNRLDPAQTYNQVNVAGGI